MDLLPERSHHFVTSVRVESDLSMEEVRGFRIAIVRRTDHTRVPVLAKTKLMLCSASPGRRRDREVSR
jgi:hypothetical protein